MKKLHVVFLILAVLVMALPAATMPLFANAVNTEKRELSKLPAVIREDGTFNQRFSDECAGVFCTVALEVPSGDTCPEGYADFNQDFNEDFMIW